MMMDTNGFFDQIKGFFQVTSGQAGYNEFIEKNNQAEAERKQLMPDDEFKFEIGKMMRNETGMQRVREMFAFNEITNSRSPQLNDLHHKVVLSGIIGVIYGGIKRTQDYAYNFVRSNRLTVFATQKDAYRAYFDFLMLQTAKGGIVFAFKLSSFIILSQGGSALISTYKNKTSPLDCVIATSATSGLLRAHCGMKGFLVGAGVGAVFGAIYGPIEYILRKYTGYLYEDIKYREFRNKLIELRKIEMNLKPHSTEYEN